MPRSRTSSVACAAESRAARQTHTADLPQARHQELGPVTLEQLLHEWAAHDLMHTVQAERALMQPFIEGADRGAPISPITSPVITENECTQVES